MTPIYQWAARHAVTPQALAELLTLLGIGAPVDTVPTAVCSGEASVQQQVRLEAARRGARVWRNNTGAMLDEAGRMVRFGLANDSAAANAVFKSSDLIGITPIVCACGHKYGVFTALECKARGWHYRPSDKRAVAQLAFINFIVSMGGIAKFVTGPEEL